MAMDTYKSTRRQLLEDQIVNSQNIMNQSMNSDMFGSGRAGAFGAIAQGLTAGIGAYSQYRAKQQLLQKESEDVAAFSEFATSQGNPELASIAARLSPETREAYLVNKSLPATAPPVPASVQEYQYFTNLPKSEQAQYLRYQGKLKGDSQSASLPAPPSGYRYTQTGDLSPIPGGPADKSILPLSADSAKVLALTEGGSSIISKLNDQFTKVDPKTGKKSFDSAKYTQVSGATLLPTPIISEEAQLFEIRANDLRDTIGRMRSGGAITSDENRDTFLKLIPKFGDKAQTVNEKLTKLDQGFKSIANNIRPPAQQRIADTPTNVPQKNLPEQPSNVQRVRKYNPQTGGFE
jgi:hypothetical protein